MSANDLTDLARIDRALRQMRRVFEPPPQVDDAGERVETSTVLVLEAVVDAGACTVRDVAHELDVAHSTASRLVTRAEEAGMVRRRPSPVDARETLVDATPRGTAVRERGARFRTERLSALTRDWPPDDVATFARLLGRFAAATGHADQAVGLRARR